MQDREDEATPVLTTKTQCYKSSTVSTVFFVVFLHALFALYCTRKRKKPVKTRNIIDRQFLETHEQGQRKHKYAVLFSSVKTHDTGIAGTTASAVKKKAAGSNIGWQGSHYNGGAMRKCTCAHQNKLKALHDTITKRKSAIL